MASSASARRSARRRCSWGSTSPADTGYGLAVLCEVLAGALTGGGCSNPANAGRLANGMLSIYLDPARFQPDANFAAEVQRLIAWVKSSEKATPEGDILMPGEIEE